MHSCTLLLMVYVCQVAALQANTIVQPTLRRRFSIGGQSDVSRTGPQAKLETQLKRPSKRGFKARLIDNDVKVHNNLPIVLLCSGSQGLRFTKKQLLPVESGSHTHSFLTLGNGQNSNVDLIVAALKYDPAPLYFTIPDTHLLLLSRGPVIRKQ